MPGWSESKGTKIPTRLGLIRLWRSEGLAAFDRVKDRDTSGNPPLIGTRNWIRPGPPPDLGGVRWLFWVEINGN
jgi:hypothetical protein